MINEITSYCDVMIFITSARIMSTTNKRRSSKRIASRILDEIQADSEEIGEDPYFIDVAFIPNASYNEIVDDDDYASNNDSVINYVDGSDNNEDNLNEDDIVGGSYEYYFQSYDNQQKLLENDHTYNWLPNEHEQIPVPEDEDLFLSDEQKESIRKMTCVEIFEMFLSKELKFYIIEATKERDFELHEDRFDVFIAILITDIFNKRKRERDYWSTHDLLRLDKITSVMSRDEFLNIKKFLKLAKNSDENMDDRIWRVRSVCDIFKKNILRFGFFSSKLSVDESMIKFFGRVKIKQFLKNKPIRFGIKLWCLCTISAYLLDFDIYCGKQDANNEKLGNCNLGTRVVMKMLHQLLITVPKTELHKYHVCFDNLFSSPDLLVHLRNLNIKVTATVRSNRVYEMQTVVDKKKRVPVPITITNKSSRGTYEAKHDEISNLNYISVKDSKVVSVLSSAAGVTPLAPVQRFSSAEKKKTDILLPRAFALYNKTMGGVDLHDQHCNDLKIDIHSKKWTWYIFLRIIEASITNALVVWNLCNSKENKKQAYDFALSIAAFYIQREEEKTFSSHTLIDTTPIRRLCLKCSSRVSTYCFDCQKHCCIQCFYVYHKITKHESMVHKNKRKCSNDECATRTYKFCSNCEIYICQNCFVVDHKKFKK